MEWVRVEQEYPPEEQKPNSLWFDVWRDGDHHMNDVKFKDGKFFEQITDGDGDYSHEEEVTNVTHWLFITPPCR